MCIALSVRLALSCTTKLERDGFHQNLIFLVVDLIIEQDLNVVENVSRSIDAATD